MNKLKNMKDRLLKEIIKEKHNGSFIQSKAELPEYVSQIAEPSGVDLSKNGGHTLVGDIDALSKIDLEREGLSRYNSYLRN